MTRPTHEPLSITEAAPLEYPEVSPETEPAQATRPRHTAIAILHLIEQRGKAITVRDRATGEVTALDEALKALGWKG